MKNYFKYKILERYRQHNRNATKTIPIFSPYITDGTKQIYDNYNIVKKFREDLDLQDINADISDIFEIWILAAKSGHEMTNMIGLKLKKCCKDIPDFNDIKVPTVDSAKMGLYNFFYDIDIRATDGRRN